MEEDGFTIWDSHVIMEYLVDKYAKDDDSLFPKDLRARAIVNERLHFECGVLFPRTMDIIVIESSYPDMPTLNFSILSVKSYTEMKQVYLKKRKRMCMMRTELWRYIWKGTIG